MGLPETTAAAPCPRGEPGSDLQLLQALRSRCSKHNEIRRAVAAVGDTAWRAWLVGRADADVTSDAGSGSPRPLFLA